ncbi:Hsp70 family protein [Labedaea rhizosphaerae]|uniref:Hsp70 protein n=1 Tax=Labedaea rhizosphaerae TaxID=598644 RepID=A0A4R6S6A1_LABRH|nr:Hsp70 family protein [Labedaea rhizosphaerae]TDP94873.1 Hsp70 protein [Labedaea rhizosphaerae]
MSHQVSVDLGATSTAAAVCRAGRAELMPLGTRSAFLPTVAFVNADRTVAFGQQAQALAPTDPGRVARQFTRRIGDPTPLRLGDASIPAEVLAARFVGHVLAQVAAKTGGAPTQVALTHPDAWGKHRLTSLRNALVAQGLGAVVFLSAAQAAAEAHASRMRVPAGRVVAVADLGGSAMTATLVRATPDGRFAQAGAPEEVEIGGLDLDEVVFEHVRAAVGPAWDQLDPADPALAAGFARLRTECELAKEALSANTDVQIPVELPGIDTSVRLTRAEFEELIAPAAAELAAALERVIGDADPVAVLLVGGTARIPLLTQVVSAQLNRPVTVAADPQGEVALGAALAVGRVQAPPEEPTKVEVRPMPADPVALPAPDRPPLPVVVSPPADKRSGRLFGLPRTTVGIAAAALVATLAGGTIALASYYRPSGAGADTGTSVTSTVDTTTPRTTTSTTTPEEPVTTTQRRRTTRQAPPDTTTTDETTTTTTDTTTTTTDDTTTTGTTTTEAAAPEDHVAPVTDTGGTTDAP